MCRPLVESRRQLQRRSGLSIMSFSNDDDDRSDDRHEQDKRYPASSLDVENVTEKSSSNKLEQLPLTLLWAQLDIRNISYDPSATRSELEALLSLSNQEHSLEEDESELSLQSLLAQLDSRNIRYPPSASRRELEQLLLQSRENVSSREEANHHGSKSKTNKVSQTLLAEQKQSLKELLAELDARGIRYAPGASRRELESILTDPTHTTTTNAAARRRLGIINDESTPDSRDKLPLREILDQLDAQNVRYAPSASRQELEKLLQRTTRGTAATERKVVSSSSSLNDDDTLVDDPLLQDDGSKPDTSGPPTTIGSSNRRTLSLQTIVQELDRRQIRYGPSASREELEHLLRESNHHMRRRRHRRQQYQQRHHQQQETSSLTDRLVKQGLALPARRTIESIRPGLSKVASKAMRQTKYWKRSLADFLAVDEEGVREAEWFCESNSKPIDVTAVRMQRPKKTTSSKSRSNARRFSKSLQEKDAVQNVKKTIITPPGRSKSVINYPYLLSPAKTEPRQELGGSPSGSSSPKDERAGSNSRRRRVYNPYGTAGVVDTRDALDRFGEAVADAAETVIWGSIDESDDGARDNGIGRRRSTKKRASKARFWKDRIEEQVDYFLGIHDNESEYNNWEKEVGAERQHVNLPKKSVSSDVPQQRKKSKKVPIWEEEGSLVSLLFGRRPSGGQLKLEKFFEQEVGTTLLTNMISSVVKGGLLVASYLCRWASVKGAIPQPVVVMAVASMFASARPRQRVKTVVFTLLILRTLGELIHGYIQGDEDWEGCNVPEFANEGPMTEEKLDVAS